MNKPDDVPKGLVAACAAAVEELKQSRELLTALEKENEFFRLRLETEKERAAILAELVDTRKKENAAQAAALDARRGEAEALRAVIAAQGELVTALRKKKRSPLARIGDVLLGAGLIAILK
ncbi:MAG TPA: hypothetical protein DEA22_09105 [Blastocatellia bacterium]|nr:hypothetical protein [Blastocatellia bacterium]